MTVAAWGGGGGEPAGKKGFTPEGNKDLCCGQGKVWGREVPAALRKNSIHLNQSLSKGCLDSESPVIPQGLTQMVLSEGAEATWRVPGEQPVPPHFYPPLKPQLNATSSQSPSSTLPPSTLPPQIVPRQSSSSQIVCSHVGLLMNLKLWFGVPFIGTDPQDCENIRIINQHTLSVFSIFETSVPHSLWIFTQCHLLSEAFLEAP